jgi:hypothetical protein
MARKFGPRIDRRSDQCTSSIIDAAITTSATNDLFSVAKALGERGVELKVIARTLIKPAKRRAAPS